MASLAEQLRAASTARDPLRITGLGTRGRWGKHTPFPDRREETLSTLGLNRVVEYSPADLTISVEAGVEVAELITVLDREGLTLGRDLPTGGTVGGFVARSASGRTPGQLVRSAVLGMRYISADGVVGWAGGKTVKNVAGFDVGRFLSGSCGTLACICEVTLRLEPKPRRVVTWSFPSDEPIAAARAAQAAVKDALAVWATSSGHVVVSAAGHEEDLDAQRVSLDAEVADAASEWENLLTMPGSHANVWCDPADIESVVRGAQWWRAEVTGFVCREAHGLRLPAGADAEQVEDSFGVRLTPWAPPQVQEALASKFDPAAILPKL